MDSHTHFTVVNQREQSLSYLCSILVSPFSVIKNSQTRWCPNIRQRRAVCRSLNGSALRTHSVPRRAFHRRGCSK